MAHTRTAVVIVVAAIRFVVGVHTKPVLWLTVAAKRHPIITLLYDVLPMPLWPLLPTPLQSFTITA